MAASATTGVMNPLIGKLTKLLGEEYKKLKGVTKQASFLKDELSTMKALLDKMELMDKLDPLAKNWRDHIREMSYDMENCIDDFMCDLEDAHAKPGFIRKMARRLMKLGKRHQIANKIEELKVLAVEANARRERYKIDDSINSIPDTVVDPRMSAIYKEAAGLVGIDGPREDLVSWLKDSQRKLKVVSVVGIRGLGKTTLAKQVYDEIGGEFNCKAFVSVSQRPDMKSILGGLQLKLGMEDSSTYELQDIIDRLREYLKHKRYYILVDDLWDLPTWNIISCAFPETGNGSKVMVTTRLDDIALSVCQNDRACVYRMKPLEERDARRLFFSTVFGSQDVYPPQFKEISVEVLKKCGGLPLAIITMASLLATHEARSLKQWESIPNSLGDRFAKKPALEEMRDILNLSYMHHPVHLRPCFLYLGMYPEDREIRRDDLVRQWIAEGFVYNLQRVDLEDVAESYFNELISRSLIQPEETIGGEVLSCRVHDMMLDLILSKSTQDNFISVAYNYEDMARLQNCEYKVRRLSRKSIDGDAALETLGTSMSQVRSYAQFGEYKYTPPLSRFKHLRVLFFEFPYLWDATIDLTAIGQLTLLRYLKVLAASAGVTLPTEIQGLVHLQTLELVCGFIESFPSDITCLANLLHLKLPYGTPLSEGVQNMKSVRTLHCPSMSNSLLEDIKGLSKLTNLKKLTSHERYGRCLTDEGADALASSIGMLRDLKHLSLSCRREFGNYDNQLESLADPPPHLDVLHLAEWSFKRLPKWIGELRFLRILSMHVLRMSSDEVRVLGELPSLLAATFQVLDVSQDKVVVGTGLFPVLLEVFFQSDGDVTAYLGFEAGAMPKLQTLAVGFGWKEWRSTTPLGMERLPCLQDIRVRLQNTSTEESRKNRRHVLADVESAFKSAARAHPRHPSVLVL